MGQSDMTEEMMPVTDGKLYELKEFVRAGCGDCSGCSECCRDMGQSIVLDPYDMFRLKTETGKTFQALMEDGIFALSVREGLIIPYLRMREDTNSCVFLNEQGRCTIHSYRPGLCRLFPLGRNYADGKLSYIRMTEACTKKAYAKVRISDWIGVRPPEAYEAFVHAWHDFRKKVACRLPEADEEQTMQINTYLLQTFFVNDLKAEDDFFAFAGERMAFITKTLGFGL